MKCECGKEMKFLGDGSYVCPACVELVDDKGTMLKGEDETKARAILKGELPQFDGMTLAKGSMSFTVDKKEDLRGC